MVSVGSYLLSAAALAALVLSLAFSASRLRKRLLPSWQSAPAHLVDSILVIALLIWLAELLGLFGFLYVWSLVLSALLLAGATAYFLPSSSASPAGGAVGGTAPEEASATAGGGGSPAATGPAGRKPWSLTPAATGPAGQNAWSLTRAAPNPWPLAIAIVVIAVVFAHWGLTAKHALDRGIFNFDSLWYHMPFAAEIAQSHSVTGLHYTETVTVNWLYPQSSELLHAVGILLTGRDTLSLFLNFGWLALAFLAAWCIGRPRGRGHLSVVAVALVLECHTLVVREPGAAKDDLMAAALLLAAIAILVNAWAGGGVAGRERGEEAQERGSRGSLPPGWPLAAAGLATGLAAGTKLTVLAMAAALTVAVLALAPAGRRRAAAVWWFLPALAGGGFWYLRNLIVAGNPLPQIAHLGPLTLPHPERLQSGRPEFSIAHYATDTSVWREYFVPGLHQAFGLLWPLVLAAAVAGAVIALARGDRVLRWLGAVVLFGLLAYLFTPLSAAGAEGVPVAFAINVRFAIPALLAGLALLPLALPSKRPCWEWALLLTLLAILVITDRPDVVLHDPARLFGLGLAFLFVLIPAGAIAWRARSAVALGILSIVILAIGYPVERHYLRNRFAPGSDIPGMHLDAAYNWARNVHDVRIGLAGTTAGFLQYGFFGTDLSNRVLYLGEKGAHGAFNAIPDCRGFRAAFDAAHLDYLVTAPFLDFIHTDRPITSPEAGWLRGETAATPLLRSGPVTVWRVRGRLNSGACGPANAPLRRIPQQPSS